MPERRIAPEAAKRHISDTTARLGLEDRRPLKPLAVFGAVAGAVTLLAVLACGGSLEPQDSEGVGEVERATEAAAAPTEEPQDSEGVGEVEGATEASSPAPTEEPQDRDSVREIECATETTAAAPTAGPLSIEGIGEIEGPVAVYGKLETAEQPDGASEDRYSVFAVDLETGRRWSIWDTTGRVGVQPAADRLIVWAADSLAIHSISLNGESEVALHSGGALAGPVSFDGSKIALAVDGSPSGEADSLIVLDVQSGDELLRVEADDPRIGAAESERWSLEVIRWSVDGAALLARGSGAGDFIVTLDGEVRETPSGLLSLNLCYGAVAPRLSSSGARSLTVVELATGREILTLTPEEGRVISVWYWGVPASGKALYATAPAGAVNERPARVWRIVDLDTGDTTVVSLDEELRDEWRWLWWLQDTGVPFPMAQCFHRHQALDPCLDLNVASQEALQFIYRDQERQERDASIRRTSLLGFIWLD